MVVVVVFAFAFAFALVALLVPAAADWGSSVDDDGKDEDAAADAAIQAAVVDVAIPIMIGLVDAAHCLQTWGKDSGRCRPASS